MRTRIVSYVPFGASTGPLPDALETQIVTPLGELSTASVHYPRQGLKAAQLDGVVEVGFEYWTGTAWVEPPACRFLSMQGSFDYLETTPTRKYDFLSVGWMLRGARVWEPAGLPVDTDGKVQFLSASAGKIMATLISNAKARGWGAGINVDFSATVTSDGKPWAKIITLAYDLDLDLDTILSNLYQQGVCDFRWEGRTLRIFNPDTALGRDLSVGVAPTRLLVADGQTSAPEQWTNEDLLSHLAVFGEDGKRWEFTNGAVGPLGRLEKVTAQGGVSDPGTAALLADPDLLKGSQTRISYTREFVVTDDTVKAPFRDYVPGDWVLGQRGTAFERLRTYSLSLTVNKDGVKGHAVLGDRLTDLLGKLAKRTKGISGGVSVGGSGVRPAPEGPDKRLPAAPTGLVVDPSAYIDAAGNAQGQVAIGWAHSGKATDGSVMGLDRYQIQYRINAVGELWKSLLSTMDKSASYSPLPLFKADGVTPEQYTFRVRVTGQNAVWSAFSAVAAVSMAADATAPPVPYFVAANLTTWLRTITVRWGGKGTTTGSNQVPMPRDFDHANVYKGSSATGPWVLVGQIRDASSWTSDGLQPTVTAFFALSAVDRAGNESALSAAFPVTPGANVDISNIATVIDAANVTIKNAREMLLGTGAQLGAKLDANDSAQAQLVTDLAGVSGGIDVVSAALAGIDTRVMEAQASADGKSTIYYVKPSGTAGLKVGDTWFDSANGNRVNRWTGTAWVVTQYGEGAIENLTITNAKIASLDGAKITADSIEGVSLKGQTVTADKVLVGGANLLPNPRFARDGHGWEHKVGVSFSDALGVGDGGSMKIDGSSVQVGCYYGFDDLNLAPRVIAGESYRVSVMAKASVTIPASSVRVYIRWYDDTGGSWLGMPSFTHLADIPANMWGNVSQILTAPAGATRAAIGLYVQVNFVSDVRFSSPAIVTASDGSLIVNGSITGSHIDAESVAAKVGSFVKLNVGNLVASGASIDTAVVDKLWADVVRSRSITTDMLLVGQGVNLLADPAFNSQEARTMREAGESGWSWGADGTRGNYTRLRSPIVATNRYVELVLSVVKDARSSAPDKSDWMDVKAGEMYRARALIFHHLPAIRSRLWVAYIFADGSSGQTVGEFYTDREYHNQVFDWTVPTGAVKAIYRHETNYNSTTVNEFVVNVYSLGTSLVRLTDSSLIVTGGITSDSLAANSVIAAKIAALAVSTDKLAANAVTADKADVGSLRAGILTANVITGTMISGTAIDGKVITGATIQTTTTANRGIKQTDTYLRAWNASGLQTFDLSAVTGNLTTLGGTITGAMFRSTTAANQGVTITGQDGATATVLAQANATVNGGTVVQTVRLSTNTRTISYGGAGGGTPVNIILPGLQFESSDRTYSRKPTLSTDPSGPSVQLQSGFLPGNQNDGSTLSLGSDGSWTLGGTTTSSTSTDSTVSGIVGLGVIVQGAFRAYGAKNFAMPHPTKPGLDLLHASTESPVSGIEYWGTGEMGADGTAVVVLPEYFESLAKERGRTVIVAGRGGPVAWTDIIGGSFTITGDPGAGFSWLVKAERFGADFLTEQWAYNPTEQGANTP